MPNTTSKIEPRALRISDFCRLYGIGRTSAYKLMASGKLATVRIGKRRLVLRDSAEQLLSTGGAK